MFPLWLQDGIFFLYTVSERLLVLKGTTEFQRMDALGQIKMP